ncbi:MAG: hypothetical protein JXA67_03450 [Micromonosporaceae bacterium]|nr:hypothetical protein [Micromonosporaceae bacterium]
MFRRPLSGAFGGEEVRPSEVFGPPESWDDLANNHMIRAMVWGLIAGVLLVTGIGSSAVEDVLDLASRPLSAVLNLAFLVCALTACLHGVALAVASIRGRRRARFPSGRLVRAVLRPGNRYVVLLACWMLVVMFPV